MPHVISISLGTDTPNQSECMLFRNQTSFLPHTPSVLPLLTCYTHPTLAHTPFQSHPFCSPTMVLRIRLARFGRRHAPIYNIVLAQARSARDSKPLEVLGTYNPAPQTPLASADTPEYQTDTKTGEYVRDEKGEVIPFRAKRYKDVKLDRSRVKYWLGVGAQPSDGVERLLCLVSPMNPLRGGIIQRCVKERVC